MANKKSLEQQLNYFSAIQATNKAGLNIGLHLLQIMWRKQLSIDEVIKKLENEYGHEDYDSWLSQLLEGNGADLTLLQATLLSGVLDVPLLSVVDEDEAAEAGFVQNNDKGNDEQQKQPLSEGETEITSSSEPGSIGAQLLELLGVDPQNPGKYANGEPHLVRLNAKSPEGRKLLELLSKHRQQQLNGKRPPEASIRRENGYNNGELDRNCCPGCRIAFDYFESLAPVFGEVGLAPEEVDQVRNEVAQEMAAEKLASVPKFSIGQEVEFSAADVPGLGKKNGFIDGRSYGDVGNDKGASWNYTIAGYDPQVYSWPEYALEPLIKVSQVPQLAMDENGKPVSTDTELDYKIISGYSPAKNSLADKEIKGFIERGRAEGQGYMLHVCDGFDNNYYPVFVEKGGNWSAKAQKYNQKSMQRVCCVVEL